MFDHISIGVSDLAKTKAFYDAVLAPIGYRCLRDTPEMLGYGRDEVGLWITPTEHPVPADMSSGLHFCFIAPSRESVDEFHAQALRTGGGDNGKPGLRPDYDATYYAAFVIDPDGYRLEAYCGGA
jgi:catechol 2,3-dioxygenase-like lactoylglutathione lyase family enzyme